MKMKVRCVKHLMDEDFFTVGKEYTWEDNRLTSDTGFTYTTMVEGSKPENWQLSSYYEFVVVPEHRFKVGDKVVALKDNGYIITTDGWEGVVTRVWFDACETPMMTVKGKGIVADTIGFDVTQKGFELDKSVQPWKIVIESSGDTTTAKYIGGKTVVKTATVTRYHTDEYSVEKAVEAVTKKLFPDTEPEEPESKYKVGDLVECTTATYGTCGKWGQLVRESRINDHMWLVDFKFEYPSCHDSLGELPGNTGLWLAEDSGFKKVE